MPQTRPASTPQSGGRPLGRRSERTENEAAFIEALLEDSRDARGWCKGSPGLTQMELQRRTGVSRAVVSRIASEFDTVLRRDPGGGPGQGQGRPPERISLEPRVGVAIGVEIRQRTGAVVLGDLTARPFRYREEWAGGPVRDHREEVLDWVKDSIAKLMAAAGRSIGEVVGIGIAFAAAIDEEGLIRDVSLGPQWHSRNVIVELRRRLGLEWGDVPIDAAGDAGLMAVAERCWGAAKDKDDILLVDWGETLASGIVLGGNLYRGTGGIAPGLGHAFVKGATATCSLCEKQGCLQTIASPAAMFPRARPPTPNQIVRRLSKPGRGKKDEAARAVEAVGHTIGMAVTVLNPAALIIGGSVGTAVIDHRWTAFDDALAHATTRSAYDDLRVVAKPQIEKNAAACGAIRWVLERHLVHLVRDPRFRERARVAQGWSRYRLQRSMPSAREYFDVAAKNARRLRDNGVMAAAYIGLGHVEIHSPRLNPARTKFQKARKLAEEEEDSYQLAWALRGLAEVEFKSGKRQAAERFACRGRDVAHRSHHAWPESGALAILGAIAWSDGSWEEAEERYTESVELLKPLDNLHLAWRLYDRGVVRLHRGVPDQALEDFGKSCQVADEHGDSRQLIWSRLGAACAYHDLPNQLEAERRLIDVLTDEQPDPEEDGLTAGLTLLGAAKVLAYEAPEQAAVLLSAADLRLKHLPRSARPRPPRDRIRRDLDDCLDPARLKRANERGRDTPFRSLIALAQEHLGGVPI